MSTQDDRNQVEAQKLKREWEAVLELPIEELLMIKALNRRDFREQMVDVAIELHKAEKAKETDRRIARQALFTSRISAAISGVSALIALAALLKSAGCI